MRNRDLVKSPTYEFNSQLGLTRVQSVYKRRLKVNIPAAASAPILRGTGHGFFPLGGGGGNKINNIGLVYPVTSPTQGDTVILFINAQFGLNTPNPSSVAFSLTDNTSDVWIPIFNVFVGVNSTAAYSGQFNLGAFYKIQGATAITSLNITSTVAPDAFDVQGQCHVSAWGANGRTPLFYEIGSNISGIANPTLQPYASNNNRISIANFWAPNPPNINSLNGAGAPGFGGVDLHGDWYILQRTSVGVETVTPSISTSAVSAEWLMGAILF